eukprot:jgi/Astpho2/5705/gw1.00079.187.1_t
MDYLHSLNILHGDLTACNVLLAASDKDQRGFVAKVADFGLSRLLQSSQTTIETDTFGTVTHMPPELLMDGILTKAADVYAFGVLLWEMYTAEKPWAGCRHVQIIHQVTSLNAKPMFPEGTPTPFQELANQCMHPDKNERPTFEKI